MTQKSKSRKAAKRTRPVSVSSVIWEAPSAIYAVDSEQALHAVLRRCDVPPVQWQGFLTHPSESSAQPALAEVQYYEGGALCIVCFGPEMFERDGLSTETILTITHEAVHVFQRVCELMGEESPGSEVQAYGVENITRNLIHAFMTLKGQRERLADVATAEQIQP